MKVRLFFIRETDKARLFCVTLKVGGNRPPRPVNPFWLPKSEIIYQKKTFEGVMPVCDVKIPDWLGNKHKLEDMG